MITTRFCTHQISFNVNCICICMCHNMKTTCLLLIWNHFLVPAKTKSNKKYVNKELQFLFELETHPRAYTDEILLGCQAWVFLQQFEHGVVVWCGRRDHPFAIGLIHLDKQNKTGITTSNTIGYVIWQPLLRLLSWCNFISVKSPHLIWASGTRRWNLRVPDLQVSCSDLT